MDENLIGLLILLPIAIVLGVLFYIPDPLREINAEQEAKDQSVMRSVFPHPDQSTPWQPCPNLPGYEMRLNVEGYRETRRARNPEQEKRDFDEEAPVIAACRAEQGFDVK